MLKKEQVLKVLKASEEVDFSRDHSYLHVCFNLKSGNLIYIKARDAGHNSRVYFSDPNVEFIADFDRKTSEDTLVRLVDEHIRKSQLKPYSCGYYADRLRNRYGNNSRRSCEHS